LCYAAGLLARKFNILPQSFDCLRLASSCYDLHRQESGWLQPLPDRLRSLAQEPRTINLDGGLSRLKDADLYAVTAFLRTTKSKRQEILFTQAARDKFFPDFNELKRDCTNAPWFKSEKGRDTVRRQIRKGRSKEAVYRFYLPPHAKSANDEEEEECSNVGEPLGLRAPRRGAACSSI
jgi:hypothetical protein